MSDGLAIAPRDIRARLTACRVAARLASFAACEFRRIQANSSDLKRPQATSRDNACQVGAAFDHELGAHQFAVVIQIASGNQHCASAPGAARGRAGSICTPASGRAAWASAASRAASTRRPCSAPVREQGEHLTSIYDGNSTSAPLKGLMWLAAYQECAQAEYTGIALEYGTPPTMEMIDALRRPVGREPPAGTARAARPHQAADARRVQHRHRRLETARRRAVARRPRTARCGALGGVNGSARFSRRGSFPIGTCCPSSSNRKLWRGFASTFHDIKSRPGDSPCSNFGCARWAQSLPLPR